MRAAQADSGARSPGDEPPSLEALLQGVAGLVSPPEVCVHLFEMSRSPTAGAEDYARVIACDPSLAARLLRLVNSPLFGLRAKVDTLPRAVAIVGMRELNALALAVSSVRAFNGIAQSLVDMSAFWRHSVLTALLARALARRSGVLHPERLFLAGLLHDIGELVLFHRLGPLMADLLMVADGDEDLLFHAEMDALGFSHAEVGGQLLRLWDFPDALREAVTHHHRPPGTSLDARIVATADKLALTPDEELLAETGRSAALAATLGLEGEARVALVQEALAQRDQTLGMLSPGG